MVVLWMDAVYSCNYSCPIIPDKNRKSENNIEQIQSAADEIKKYKELLDQGIITQEEFETKKQQLLKLI